MESTPINTAPPKVGRIRKGWQITKSSWRVLKLDKELASLPLISFFVTLLALIPLGFLALASLVHHSHGSFGQPGSSVEVNSHFSGWEGVLIAFGVYLVTTLVANFFSGALIFGAVERFRGDNPSVGSSLAGARHKFRPLLFFSLMVATVGFVLQGLEERLPLAGKIAVYIFDAAWSIANIFAIPVIVLSDQNVTPLQATKQSVQIIKKIWGESVVVNLGIGSIALLGYLIYVTAFTGLTVGLLTIQHGHVSGRAVAPAAILIIVGVIGFICLSLIFTALSSIAKAALYFYATTGEAPAQFDSKLLHAAMTPKKARKIFGSA